MAKKIIVGYDIDEDFDPTGYIALGTWDTDDSGAGINAAMYLADRVNEGYTEFTCVTDEDENICTLYGVEDSRLA